MWAEVLPNESIHLYTTIFSFCNHLSYTQVKSKILIVTFQRVVKLLCFPIPTLKTDHFLAEKKVVG